MGEYVYPGVGEHQVIIGEAWVFKLDHHRLRRSIEGPVGSVRGSPLDSRTDALNIQRCLLDGLPSARCGAIISRKKYEADTQTLG